jgi:hypothetical protein
MLEVAEVSKLLGHLLAARSPEYGARLKQRLNALLRERGLEPFDERQYGFRKFQDFLERSQGDVLKVVRTNGGGDIQVILKDLPPDVVDAPVPQPASPPSERAGRPIRSEVWQAFANPDPERRRFLDRQTFQICHYTPNHYPEVKDLVERNPSQYAEIPPIAAETQKGWMRDFLAAVPITGSERAVLDQMLEQPYTSALNAAFTRLLAGSAGHWREHRVKLVLNTIFSWAKTNGVDINRLRKSEEMSAIRSPDAAAVGVLNASITSRTQAMKLLELISDEDIGRVVLPVLLSTILIKSRI